MYETPVAERRRYSDLLAIFMSRFSDGQVTVKSGRDSIVASLPSTIRARLKDFP
jgi:hypothetical protein